MLNLDLPILPTNLPAYQRARRTVITPDERRRYEKLWKMRSVDEYEGQRVLDTEALERGLEPMTNAYCVMHVRGSKLLKVSFGHNLRTTAGLDWENKVLGGDVGPGFNGTTHASTAPTATTLTDSGSPAWTTNQWKDHIVSIGGVYMVILSNTAGVLTGDRWNVPNTIATQSALTTLGAGAAGTTPGTNVAYSILPGAAPLIWLALDTGVHTPAVGDTTLTTETSASGLARTVGLYAHTGGNTFYTLSKTFTNNSGGNVGPINNAGALTGQNGSTLGFYTAVSNPPTLSALDQLLFNPWTFND